MDNIAPPSVTEENQKPADNQTIDAESIQKALLRSKADLEAKSKEALGLQNQLAELQAKLKSLEGIDPKELERLRNETAAVEANRKKTVSELQSRTANQQAQIDQLTQNLSDAVKSRQETIISFAITKAYMANGGKEGKWVDVIVSELAPRVRIADNDELYVCDPGTKNISLSEKGTPLSISDLVLELKGSGDSYMQSAFKPTNLAGGSGRVEGLSGHGRRNLSTEQLQNLTPLELVKLARQN